VGFFVSAAFGVGVGVAIIVGFWLLANLVDEMHKYASKDR
jgi:Na+-driven multidrug efflux pump